MVAGGSNVMGNIEILLHSIVELLEKFFFMFQFSFINWQLPIRICSNLE